MARALEKIGAAFCALSAACAMLAASSAAVAADLPSNQPPPAPPPPVAAPLGFFVKLGLTYGINTSTSKLYAQPAPVAGLPQVEVPGVGANIGNVATLGLEAGYFVMPNISVDVSAGIPMWAKVTTKGGFLAGGVIPVPSGTELASIMPSFIPVTILYHFTEFGRFQPYIGAGVAPVFSFSQKSAFDTGVTVDPTVGLVLQAGMDVMFDPHWGWSFDVKKVFANGDAHATGVNLAVIGLPIQAPLATTLKTNFEPWILSTGVDYRF
jgi:outer membrane protein